jgi:hypothetical protein
MSIQAGVGLGVGEDAFSEAVNATKDALRSAGGQAHLCIVFASSKYNPEKTLEGVSSVAGNAVVIGCTTAGEITTDGPAKRNSIAVMAINAPEISFTLGVGEDIKSSPRLAGRAVAQEVLSKAKEALKAFVMIPDVLAGNGAETVRGVLDVLGEHMLVVGGAAGDDFKFEKTYQFANNKVLSGAVVGLGMSGNFKLGIGVKHGWLPIGIPRKVTRSEGSVLHELDNKPAISIYDDYFGEQAKELRTGTLAQLAITYPLGMKVSGSEEMLIRDALSVNETGSITCAAEIPEGADIQLMIGSREDAVRVAKEAAVKAIEGLDGGKPKAVIIFNCIARNKLFGERSGEEISAIQEAIGKDVPLIGFYTYGEQAPLGGEVKNIERCNPAFHNETVVICVVGE